MERGWFHVTTHTYGAWLYGDPRGFRTRHHREHVEGDYKDPPPKGRYKSQYERSVQSLKQIPVILAPIWRPRIGLWFHEKLIELGAELIAISVSGQHIHCQVRMPVTSPRKWTGLAKKHVWHAATETGWTGKLWAVRSKATPILDKKHQENVFHYILRHKTEGAWVWCYREPPPALAGEESPPAAPGGL